MKKVLEGLIAGVLCLSLSSCGYIENYGKNIIRGRSNSFISKSYVEKKKRVWNVDGEKIEVSKQGGFFSGKSIGIRRRVDVFSVYFPGKDFSSIEVFVNWRFGDKKNYRLNVSGVLEKRRVYYVPLEDPEKNESMDVYIEN